MPNDTAYFLTKAKQDNAPNIGGISEEQRAEVLAFLQGAVYVWCKIKGAEEFAARDLVGGENKDWNGTPLQCLYDTHISAGKSEKDAFDTAAQDAGHYLKWLVHNDERDFADVPELSPPRHYRWNIS